MQNFRKSSVLCKKEVFSKRLYEKRKEREISLKKVSKELSIDERYLKLIEKGEYDKLPEGLYGRKFIREYSLFLGINPIDILDSLGGKNKKEDKTDKDFFSNQVIKKHSFLIFPKIVRSFLIIVAVFSFFIYLGFYLENIISPPYLELIYPVDDLIIKNTSLEVVGRSENNAEVLINNETVLINENGFFKKEVNFKKGINTITVIAKKKYGKEAKIEKQIFISE